MSARYHLIESSLARWLLDLEGGRYQSMEMGSDPARAVVFGAWHGFTRIEVRPGGTVLIHPAESGHATLRFRAVRSRSPISAGNGSA